MPNTEYLDFADYETIVCDGVSDAHIMFDRELSLKLWRWRSFSGVLRRVYVAEVVRRLESHQLEKMRASVAAIQRENHPGAMLAH